MHSLCLGLAPLLLSHLIATEPHPTANDSEQCMRHDSSLWPLLCEPSVGATRLSGAQSCCWCSLLLLLSPSENDYVFLSLMLLQLSPFLLPPPVLQSLAKVDLSPLTIGWGILWAQEEWWFFTWSTKKLRSRGTSSNQNWPVFHTPSCMHNAFSVHVQLGNHSTQGTTFFPSGPSFHHFWPWCSSLIFTPLIASLPGPLLCLSSSSPVCPPAPYQ